MDGWRDMGRGRIQEQMDFEVPPKRLGEGRRPRETGTVTKLQVKTFFTLPPTLLF